MKMVNLFQYKTNENVKQIATIIIMSFLSFLGFGKNSESKYIDVQQESDTLKKPNETQLDEIYQLALDGIKFAEEDFIQNGTFQPYGFTLSDNKAFELIIYTEEGESDTLLTDYVYEKTDNIVKEEFKKDSIRIACLVYNGILKSEKYPNGTDCFSFLFRSKEFENVILISFPIKPDNNKLLFGESLIQIYK